MYYSKNPHRYSNVVSIDEWDPPLVGSCAHWCDTCNLAASLFFYYDMMLDLPQTVLVRRFFKESFRYKAVCGAHNLTTKEAQCCWVSHYCKAFLVVWAKSLLFFIKDKVHPKFILILANSIAGLWAFNLTSMLLCLQLLLFWSWTTPIYSSRGFIT